MVPRREDVWADSPISCPRLAAVANLAKVDWATIRRLAVQSDTDPKTIRKLLSGLPVRGSAGKRGRRVLEEEGYIKEETEASKPH